MADAPDSAPATDVDRHALVAEAMACRQAGQLEQAAALFQKALASAPADAALLLYAGETLYRLGRLFAAADATAAALAQAPKLFEAAFLAGRVLTGLGRSAESVAALERAVLLRPDEALAWRFLAAAHYALGRPADAAAAFAHADTLQPQPAEFYNQLGIDLLGQRRAVEAEAAFRHAVTLEPRLAPAHQNLGAALAAQDRLAEALGAETRATELAPSAAAAWNNRAVFEGTGGDFADARHHVLRALEIEPDHPDALNSLAQMRLEEGDAEGALALVRRALGRQPTHRAAGDALLIAQNYVATPSQAALTDAKIVAARLRPDGPPFPFAGHDRDPVRRLRIGYVSGDFRRHSCASFLRPLFAAHDPQAVEIIAYSENPRDDDVTDGLRAHVHGWRPVAGLGDAAVAELIHRDRIDILLDLSGHTAGNRLAVFALKPAPVQVTWLGYPATTGLAEIDYRLTDAVADPPGTGGDTDYTERLWRLPECFLVYAPEESPPPVDRTGGTAITFGSFNHLPKVTPEMVALWSRILAAVPGSRLLMKAKRLGDADVRHRYEGLFAEHGIAADRLELVGWQAATADHLDLYRRIDVALDPFPYNGTTTTCEALSMGVPVITLAGDHHAGRVGMTLLRAAGHVEWVTRSPAEYIERAVALAQAPADRARLRAELRRTLATSPLCDAAGFARRLELAFREMWRRWCAAEIS